MPQPFIARCWIYKTWETPGSTTAAHRPATTDTSAVDSALFSREQQRKKSLSRCKGKSGRGESERNGKAVAIGTICSLRGAKWNGSGKSVWRGLNADESPIRPIGSNGFIFVMQRFSWYRHLVITGGRKPERAARKRIYEYACTSLAVERKERGWIDTLCRISCNTSLR